MPLHVQNAKITVNQTGYFKFPGEVAAGSYVVGFSAINIAFRRMINLKSFTVSLAHGQSGHDTISVTFNATAEDEAGNAIFTDGNTTCTAVVIAWVGSSDTSTVYMQNIAGVPPQGTAPISLPPNVLEVYTFLSGLSVQLPQSQGVTNFSASASANYSPVGSTVVVTGHTQLNGGQGTVDVGLLATLSANAPYQISTRSSSNRQDPLGTPFDLSFSPAISELVSPVISFNTTATGAVTLLVSVDTTITEAVLPAVAVRTGNFWNALVGEIDRSGATGEVTALVLGVNQPK